jgi:hypothetical protein
VLNKAVFGVMPGFIGFDACLNILKKLLLVYFLQVDTSMVP